MSTEKYKRIREYKGILENNLWCGNFFPVVLRDWKRDVEESRVNRFYTLKRKDWK